ncbi:MAG: DUF5615 family PIN-like protein [Candidatus Caldarchaeum sp.]|nr:DUF5615 family PIN-like protein [Candidatus Caldarchaeum sp.]MDW8360395.1 Mut7-C RNAse domain-containing protein [Candidatus Caldarchaeum sp.]
MRFLLDTMLGHLLTWLRLLGYDTLYNEDLSDDELLETAKNEGRILITRDRDLARKSVKHKVETVLLDSTDVVESLRKIQAETRISLIFDIDRSRCPDCNTPLEKLSTNPLRWRCVNCGKDYWRGRHWRNISKTLEKLNQQ